MGNHTVMFTRPEPDTLRPTSRPNIKNTNCCSHCGSGIDAKDKTCTHCGAPNENYKQAIKKKQETWGEYIKEIEKFDPCKFIVDAQIGNEYDNAIRNVENELHCIQFDNSLKANQKRLQLESLKSELKKLAFGV